MLQKYWLAVLSCGIPITWLHFTSFLFQGTQEKELLQRPGMKSQHSHLSNPYVEGNENSEGHFSVHNFGVRKSSLEQLELETVSLGSCILGKLMSAF